MADVSVKMGVSGISQFKQGMNEAQASVKTLDAALKANEKQFQKSGNAEEHYAAQTTLLNQKLKQQKQIIENAEKALKHMEDNGVSKSSTGYQNMQRKLIEATSAMMDTQDQLDNLGNKASGTAEKTDKLANSLGGLNKKVSLQQVISAVDSITNGLENAAKKAVNLGKELWDQIMDSARRADDTATMAEMYGIDLDTFLRMQKLVAGGMDTSVEAMLSAQDKMKKGVGSGSKTVLDYLKELHVGIREGVLEDWTSWKQKDPAKMFWEAGQAIMAMGVAYDKEAAAQAIFGRSWKELVPLFNTYHSLEEYNAALEEQTVNSEETIRDLAALNDAVGKLESSWTTLKDEVLGALAPALQKGADSISGLLDSLTEYLKTEDGQKLLESMGKAVEGLFKDISKIDPQEVVEGFTGIFNSVIEEFKWLEQNSGTVIGALEAIVIGWGTLELTGGALKILQLIQGIQGLAGGGAASGASAAGAAAGKAFATGFTNAFVAAAPILAAMAGVTAIAVTPATVVQKNLEEKWKQKQEERLAAAEEANEQNADFIRDAAGAVGPKKNADGTYKTGAFGFLDMNPTSETARLLMDLSSRQGLQRAQLFNAINAYGKYTNGNFTTDLLTEFWANPYSEKFNEATINEMLQNITDALIESEKPKIEVEPKVPEDSAEQIAEQVGEVIIPATLQISAITGGGEMGMGINGWPTGGGGGGPLMYIKEYANGLPLVPFDGYPEILHKGKRVVPAREVAASRNYSSNLYVESMYMNNGTDAEGLATAMAAAQRRTSAGFGS